MLRKRGDPIRPSASLLDASRAAARWEVEAGRLILARRKKWLLLAVLPVLIGMALQAAAGADLLPVRIPVLGGSKAYIPATVTRTMFMGSILVGLLAGLITGVIGAGGGYILTPALMSFGVKGIMAVGTDQFHLFAKAIMGTTLHRKLGNVNVGLALWFVVGSLGGVTLGGHVNRAIFQYSPALSDALISAVYVVVLGTLGVYSILDWRRLRRQAKAGTISPEGGRAGGVAGWLQRLPLWPRIAFDRDVVPGGRSISVYPVIVCGFIVGTVAAIMGVGGGFITFPMFVYGLGVSTFTTVGTDILQIVFTTSYSSIFQYAVYGYIFYSVSIGMLLGSLVGVQIGAMVTTMVSGAQIRAFYSLTILAGFANRLCALPRKLADLGYLSAGRSAVVAVEHAGTVIFFAFVGFFALWILREFWSGVRAARARDRAVGVATPLVVRPGRLAIGAAGLVVFGVLLAFLVAPGNDGRTRLRRADTLFNRFAKASAYSIPEAARRLEPFVGLSIDFGVRPREMADERKLACVLSASGLESRMLDDGRVRITGRFDAIVKAALADAELAHRSDGAELTRKCGLTPHEVAYCWWIIMDGVARRFVQDGRNAEADYAKFVSRKVLEPAYNFVGIEPARVGDHLPKAILLLGFYVLYTLWYGFSIMLVFDGFGISLKSRGEKKEL